MNIGILGTGMVGRSHASKMTALGHSVMMGTHNVEKKLASTDVDAMGNPPFAEWHKGNMSVKLGTFTEAASFGDIIYNVLKGEITLETLKTIQNQLSSKVLIDISNPLDFSKGMPPSLSICNTGSLGEQIQAALPKTKVVKAFNTLNASLQVNPVTLANGDHDLFICGNEDDAKIKVVEIAKSYGWKNIIDLGDISNARGTEMLLPIWLRLWNTLKTANFNFKIMK